MAKGPNSQDNHEGKKTQQGQDAPLENSRVTPSPDRKNKQPTKSYAEILKGFEEIEKIFNRDKKKS